MDRTSQDMQDPEHNEDWQEFKQLYPHFFHTDEQPPSFHELQGVLEHYGPELAAIAAEGQMTKKKVAKLEDELNGKSKTRIWFHRRNVLLIFGFFLLAISILFPPHVINSKYAEPMMNAKMEGGQEKPQLHKYDFLIFNIKYNNFRFMYNINYDQLILEWMFIVIVFVFPSFLLRRG